MREKRELQTHVQAKTPWSKVVFLHMPQTHLECLIFFATDPFWRVEGAHAARRGPRGAARPVPFWSS